MAGARAAIAAPSSTQPAAHQVDEVVAVEALPGVLVDSLRTRLEALDRIAAALDVRPVRREHAHVRTDLIDDPADRLGRIRRDTNLPLDVLAGLELELAQALLALGECLERGVELA